MWKVLNTEVGRFYVHDRIPDLNVKGKLISADKQKLNQLAKHLTQNSKHKQNSLQIRFMQAQKMTQTSKKRHYIVSLYTSTLFQSSKQCAMNISPI